MALEQYQSEFTAEEFENAIRAVPKIGANGNWFIGDKDTGVFAGGVKITGTTSVGQTIVVKAVDENGKPTVWEAVKLPEGGSEWELFDTITLEEAVSNFGFGWPQLDAENEFRDKGYKKLLLRIWLPKVDTDSTAKLIIGFNTWGGGETYEIPNAFVLSKKWEGEIRVYAEMFTDKYHLINVARGNNVGSVLVGNRGNNYITDKFSYFRLINNYPVGTTITIWGSKK